MTRVRGDPFRVHRKTIITDEEFKEMLRKADRISNKFYRLRAKALLCILRLTGKRREEIANLELGDVYTEGDFLYLRFRLEKKKRRFKVCPECKSRNTVKADYCQKCAFPLPSSTIMKRGRSEDSIKAVPLSDPLTKPILEYRKLLETFDPKPRYYFPSTRNVFGLTTVILTENHLTGRQLFNIVRSLSDKVWMHLFRETVAADIIKQDPSIIGAFKVQRRLDLESYQTGFNYLRRFAADIIQREEVQKRK